MYVTFFGNRKSFSKSNLCLFPPKTPDFQLRGSGFRIDHMHTHCHWQVERVQKVIAEGFIFSAALSPFKSRKRQLSHFFPVSPKVFLCQQPAPLLRHRFISPQLSTNPAAKNFFSFSPEAFPGAFGDFSSAAEKVGPGPRPVNCRNSPPPPPPPGFSLIASHNNSEKESFFPTKKGSFFLVMYAKTGLVRGSQSKSGLI